MNDQKVKEILSSNTLSKKTWRKPDIVSISKEALTKHIQVAARSNGGSCRFVGR